VSYFLVISAALVPWLAAASLWPGKLHYLFGERAGASFQVLILYLSPIYILFSLVAAGLKAVLEIRWAQTLMRVLTLGSFVLYSVLLFAFRQLLASHYTGLIWSIYLGLTALATVFGLWRLLRLESWPCDWRSLRFFLPHGFWSYTLSQEQASAVWFFIERLDLILVLNFGGLALLGQYIVIITLGDVIRVTNRVFLETLLPSLTNLLGQRNLDAASQVLRLNFRILFIADITVTSGIMLLIGWIALLWGPQYASLRMLFLLLVLLVGLSAPGAVGSTLLSSVGKQQRTVWVALGQLALFTALFLSLWARWHLLGAVLATGISTFVAYISLLVVARYSVPIRFSVGKDYAKFMLVGSVAGLVAMRVTPLALSWAVVAWVGAVLCFLAWTHYGREELIELSGYFLPRLLRDGVR
jgi:O-antigen/teichoic acid export membrane protein